MRFFSRRRPEYIGYVEALRDRRLHGWAFDQTRPGDRLEVEIYSAGARIGVARAKIFRDDLAHAGIGDGGHAFAFDLPEGDFPEESLAVKVSGADFWLPDGVERRRLGSFSRETTNSPRRGFPVLRPALSRRAVDDEDVALAAELLKHWQVYAERGNSEEFVGRKTLWTGIVSQRHRTLLELLQGRDVRALAAHLVNVQRLPASDGLAQGDRAYRDFLAATQEGRRAAVAPFHDMLASLAQYLALERAECAEQNFEGETLAKDQDFLAQRISEAVGFSIAPPAVFDGLYGLAIDGRVLHGRDIQALYAALRAIEASGVARPRICEIGGGFGKAAQYAWLRGVRHYTIVDLPSVSAMQFFYLRKTLPGVRVAFRDSAEPASEAEGIELVVASRLDQNAKLGCDIALNCDSFPEMGDSVCRRYFAALPAWAPLLLSINQEANREISGPSDRQSVVGRLLPEYGFVRRYRFRSWIRRGYVEELWSAPMKREAGR